MKVIFLDFDGVITNIHTHFASVNKEFVTQLKKIIERTNAKVVVTSFRKNEFIGKKEVRMEETSCYHSYLKPLIEMKVEIYDYTSYIKSSIENQREEEILSYLNEHQEIEQFVIIEDDYIMKTLYPHQVFIENSDGLRAEYVAPAIRILTGNLGFYPEEYNRSETFQERIERSFPNVIIKEEKMTKNLEKVLNKCKRDITYYNKK